MLDPVLLKTFLLIAEGLRFSEVSRKLDVRQSTVSDHIRRLEQCVGHQLFLRDTHSITITPYGEALIGFARTILEANARAERFFAGTRLRGRLRFGASEDLVEDWLPLILKQFVDEHPDVDLEFTIALSATLSQRFDAGELDIVLCKRWPGESRGQLVWRDDLVWVRGEDSIPAPSQLILYPPPSLTRSIVLAALEQARLNWRIICTSDNLSGLVATAKMGLGITVSPRRLIPAGLVEVADSDLPKLGSLDFILLRHQKTGGAPAAELSAAILEKTQSA